MIRKDTNLYKKVESKFLEGNIFFPSSDFKTFLEAVFSTIQYYRSNVFKVLKDDQDVGYCSLPMLKGFSNLEQELFANKIISDLVTDLGNGFYHLIESKQKNDRFIEYYLRDFFRQSERQRDQILSEIKYQKDFARIHKEYGLFNLEEELEYLSSNKEKAEAINRYIFEFELNPEANQFLPSNILIARNMLANLFFEKEFGIGLEKQEEGNLKKPDDRLDIFYRNGFRLFDYLMKNHLSSGKGRKSDVAFFYRMMNEREKNPLIHGKQTPFKSFVYNNYSGFDSDWKFKSWNDINTEKRRQAYSSAKSAIGLK